MLFKTFFSQNEILYEKKKKRRRLHLRRLGKRPPPTNPQDGQPMNDWEKEMRQVSKIDEKWNKCLTSNVSQIDLMWPNMMICLCFAP